MVIAVLEKLLQFRCREGAIMAEDALCSASLAAALCSAVAQGEMCLLESEPRHASLWRGADAIWSFLPADANSSTLALCHSILAPWAL